jgi:hypothetical protein
MDDIAFFDSQPYEHRGGIWQDASRREKQPSLVAEQTPYDAQSTIPVVASEAPSTLSQEPPSQPRSQSAEELSTSLHPSSPISPNGTVTDVTAPELPAPSRVSNRRRSWFSSVRSDTQGSLSRRNSDADEAVDFDEQRGRAPQPDKTVASTSRSHSTPHAVDSSLPITPAQERDDPYLDMHLSPQSAQRPPSLHSSTREHSKSKSIDSSSSHPDTTSTPSKNSGNDSTPSTPNSFLSTLKSRAGDKQALSNTAKETMRKWGVNWANLRKESSNKPSTPDDTSDHGSIGSLIGSRLQPDSHPSVAQKTRASYAEVRAAVEERKGKDRDRNAHSRSPSPIPIPGAQTDDTADGNSPVAAPRGSNLPPSPDSVSRTYSSASSSGRLSVSEKSNISRKSSPGPSRVAAESDMQDRPEPVQPPMHVVQPQAKTMTIPGIHASHRGEIMSMGYVAPQPQQEGKPSIQSVYRLWKSPPSTGQDQQQKAPPQTHQSQDQSQNADGDPSERDRDITLLVSPPTANFSPQVLPRPVPPPLPPRSIPVAISRPPFEPSSSPPSESSASQTLKSIANKDDLKRASLENGSVPPSVSRIDTEPLVPADLSNSVNSDHSPTIAKFISITNPGPPLPPRRIPS